MCQSTANSLVSPSHCVAFSPSTSFLEKSEYMNAINFSFSEFLLYESLSLLPVAIKYLHSVLEIISLKMELV